MAYRFNNGRGGVTCDQCNLLIDQDLSYKEYEEDWGKSKDDGDFCMRCKTEKIKAKAQENEKKNILDDGWRN